MFLLIYITVNIKAVIL